MVVLWGKFKSKETFLWGRGERWMDDRQAWRGEYGPWARGRGNNNILSEIW